MICKKCGANARDGARFCEVCGAPLEQEPVQQAPVQPATYSDPYHAPAGATPTGEVQDYLVWNIVLTVLSFCCSCIGLVTGIVGIVFSSQVRSALAAGNRAEAEAKSKTAKTMCFVTLGLVILGVILNIILFATGMISELVA